MASAPLYDRIGRGYVATRRTDPRLAARIWQALGDARTVLNVGAGSGSYEPPDRQVTAVEPSAVMLSQRRLDRPPAVQAHAEALPFSDSSFDATMAVLSDHHWHDRRRGLHELRRVARRRVVVFTWDPRFADDFWLTRDYLPAFKLLPGMSIEDIVDCLGAAPIEPVPVPHDCRDGFYHAFWARPEAYLDERVRAGISVFARIDKQQTTAMVARLRADLKSGAWRRRNGDLLDRADVDLGYRLVVADFARAGGGRVDDRGKLRAVPLPYVGESTVQGLKHCRVHRRCVSDPRQCDDDASAGTRARGPPALEARQGILCEVFGLA